jgi:hypothetical protein
MNEQVPTFAEYMLANGMPEPDRIPPDALAKWKMKYALIHMPEPPSVAAPAPPPAEAKPEPAPQTPKPEPVSAAPITA